MPRMLRRSVRLVLLAGLIPLVTSCGNSEQYTMVAVGERFVCRLDREGGEVICASAIPHEEFLSKLTVIPAGSDSGP